MIKKQNYLLILPLAVVFSIVGLLDANYADAIDWKFFSGARCFANNGRHEVYLQHRYTGTYNRHATKKYLVTCPITRDEYTSDHVEYVWLRINQNAATTTRCWLRSSDTDGSTHYASSKEVTGSGWIGWTTPFPLITPTAGILTVQCKLAPKAFLYKIYHGESGDTNTR